MPQRTRAISKSRVRHSRQSSHAGSSHATHHVEPPPGAADGSFSAPSAPASYGLQPLQPSSVRAPQARTRSTSNTKHTQHANCQEESRAPQLAQLWRTPVRDGSIIPDTVQPAAPPTDTAGSHERLSPGLIGGKTSKQALLLKHLPQLTLEAGCAMHAALQQGDADVVLVPDTHVLATTAIGSYALLSGGRRVHQVMRVRHCCTYSGEQPVARAFDDWRGRLAPLSMLGTAPELAEPHAVQDLFDASASWRAVARGAATLVAIGIEILTTPFKQPLLPTTTVGVRKLPNFRPDGPGRHSDEAHARAAADASQRPTPTPQQQRAPHSYAQATASPPRSPPKVPPTALNAADEPSADELMPPAAAEAAQPGLAELLQQLPQHWRPELPQGAAPEPPAPASPSAETGRSFKPAPVAPSPLVVQLLADCDARRSSIITAAATTATATDEPAAPLAATTSPRKRCPRCSHILCHCAKRMRDDATTAPCVPIRQPAPVVATTPNGAAADATTTEATAPDSSTVAGGGKRRKRRRGRQSGGEGATPLDAERTPERQKQQKPRAPTPTTPLQPPRPTRRGAPPPQRPPATPPTPTPSLPPPPSAEAANRFASLEPAWDAPEVTASQQLPPSPAAAAEKPSTLEDDTYLVERVASAKFQASGKLYYLLRWSGYADAESTWEPWSKELQRTLDDWHQPMAAEMRVAAKVGAEPAVAPLVPGTIGWLTDLSTKAGKRLLRAQGSGGIKVRVVPPPPAAPDAPRERKVHVMLLDGVHDSVGLIVRAWPQHVWPIAAGEPAAGDDEYDADDVGSMKEPSPPASPRFGPAAPPLESPPVESAPSWEELGAQFIPIADGAAGAADAAADPTATPPQADAAATTPPDAAANGGAECETCIEQPEQPPEEDLRCPAGCCGATFALTAGQPRWLAEHHRARAIATHIRKAVAGHRASGVGFSHERMARARLIWCGYCGEAQAATASKPGFLASNRKFCLAHSHLSTCKMRRSSSTPSADFLEQCDRQPGGRRWATADCGPEQHLLEAGEPVPGSMLPGEYIALVNSMRGSPPPEATQRAAPRSAPPRPDRGGRAEQATPYPPRQPTEQRRASCPGRWMGPVPSFPQPRATTPPPLSAYELERLANIHTNHEQLPSAE